MAAKKKPVQRSDYEDDDDFEVTDDDWKDGDDTEVDAARGAVPPGVRLRDWRDVERFREERELKRLMREDDLLFDD